MFKMTICFITFVGITCWRATAGRVTVHGIGTSFHYMKVAKFNTVIIFTRNKTCPQCTLFGNRPYSLRHWTEALGGWMSSYTSRNITNHKTALSKMPLFSKMLNYSII